jgi:hypothetical protein
MYLLADVSRQRHDELLEQAQLHRVARRVQALNRNRRREARAQRQMSRARLESSRLRRELEAEA